MEFQNGDQNKRFMNRNEMMNQKIIQNRERRKDPLY